MKKIKISCSKLNVYLGSVRGNLTNEGKVKKCNRLLGRGLDLDLMHDIAHAFQFADGMRILEFSSVKKQVGKPFGSSVFNWVFGLVASDQFKLAAARYAGERLRRFILGDAHTGVKICERIEGKGHCYAFEQVRATKHPVEDCVGRTILIPLGKKSLKFGGDLYLRADIEDASKECLPLKVKRLALTFEDGLSIAGLGDICDFAMDVRHASEAFSEVLGIGYDVLGANGSIYEAWAAAVDEDRLTCEFAVDLSAFAVDARHVCLRFVRACMTAPWQLTLEADGGTRSVGLFASCADYAIDLDAAYDGWMFTVSAFREKSVEELVASVNFSHCLSHIDRFDEAFVSDVVENPHKAGEKFVLAVRRAVECLREDHSAWIATVFNGGQEHSMYDCGDYIESNIALLAPLYLTDDAVTPSVYLVACAGKDGCGNVICSFPSVLSVEQAESNYRNLCRVAKDAVGRAT